MDPPMVPATGPATVDGEKTAVHKLVREFSSDVLRRAPIQLGIAAVGAQTSVRRRVEHQHKRWRSSALAGG